jgi:hypothetical protein
MQFGHLKRREIGGVADGGTRSPAGAAGARLSQFPVAGEVRAATAKTVITAVVDRCGRKDFEGGLRAILIQDERHMRKFDSKSWLR